MRKLSLLLVTLCAVALVGGATAQDYVLGIVFDAGGKFDGSFNEGTWRGMIQAIDELEADEGLEIDLLEFEGDPGTAAEGQRRIASEGSELIVTPGFAQADAVASNAAAFPDTSWTIIDAVVDAPNVRSVLFREHEGSFLVGYIAGTMSQTGTVGFVGGMDIPLIRRFNLGYEEGVKAACADCTVISNYVGTTPAAWSDPARAKELATAQQAQGADIIYAAAGASGNGVIDFVTETMCFSPSGALRDTPLAAQLEGVAVSDAYASKCGADAEPLFYIGVDSNQNPSGDTDGDPATLNHGLTSMLKRVDVAGFNAVMDVINGTFEGGVIQELGLAENGVDYAVDEFNQALLPAEVIDMVNGVKQQIIDGDIEVTDFYDL